MQVALSLSLSLPDLRMPQFTRICGCHSLFADHWAGSCLSLFVFLPTVYRTCSSLTLLPLGMDTVYWTCSSRLSIWSDLVFRNKIDLHSDCCASVFLHELFLLYKCYLSMMMAMMVVVARPGIHVPRFRIFLLSCSCSMCFVFFFDSSDCSCASSA